VLKVYYNTFRNFNINEKLIDYMQLDATQQAMLEFRAIFQFILDISTTIPHWGGGI